MKAVPDLSTAISGLEGDRRGSREIIQETVANKRWKLEIPGVTVEMERGGPFQRVWFVGEVDWE